jgi:hypothetical protein
MGVWCFWLWCGGSLLLLELVGKAEPRVVLKAVTPDNAPVIGVGLQQVGQRLFFL